MNIADYVLIALVIAALTGALVYMFKKKKSGGSIGCCGSCSNCSGCNLESLEKKSRV